MDVMSYDSVGIKGQARHGTKGLLRTFLVLIYAHSRCG